MDKELKSRRRLLAGLGTVAAASLWQSSAASGEKHAADHEELGATVGVLTAAYLYQSQIGIGLLADAFRKKVYDEKSAGELLAPMTKFAETIQSQFKKLAESGEVSDDDLEVISSAVEITELLIKQSKKLEQVFSKNDKKSNAEFEKLRLETQEKIDAAFAEDEAGDKKE